MIVLTFDEGGVGEMLRELDQKLSDFAAPIAEILEQELMDAEHAVAIAKGVRGVQWPPMAAATIASGRDPSTLLEKSGRLLDSLARGASENIFEVESHSGRAGSSVLYASAQQGGFGGHPYRPPRPFLVWDEARIGGSSELGGTCLEIFERHFFFE